MSGFAIVDGGVFLAEDGIFSECCCHVAYLSLQLSSGGQSVIVAIEDRGNAGHVLWKQQIFPADDHPSMWAHGGDLFLAYRPASGPSVLRLKGSDGSTVHSASLTAQTGGGAITLPGIAVNGNGQVFVVAAGSDSGFNRDCWRLTTALAVNLAAQPGEELFFRPPMSASETARFRKVTLDNGGAPCFGSLVGDVYRINNDFTFDQSFDHHRWRTGDEISSSGGQAPTVHWGGPDVLIVEGDNKLYNHTSFNGPKRLIGECRGTYANTGAPQGETTAWVPGLDQTIYKTRITLADPVVLYTKTLGTDFLTDGTWNNARLDLLRHNDGRLWVLARDIDTANPRAVLVVFDEIGPHKSITGATNATPIVVTAVGHGLTTGDEVRIAGIAGNTAANGTFKVVVLTADTFQLQTLGGTNVAGNGAYLSGGVVVSLFAWTEAWRLNLVTEPDVLWTGPHVVDSFRGWALNGHDQGWGPST